MLALAALTVTGKYGQLQRARIPQAAQQSGYGERPVEGDAGGLAVQAVAEWS